MAGSTITVYFYDDYGNLNYKKMFSYEDYIDRPTSVLRSNMTAMTIMYGYDTTGNMKRLCSYGSSKKIAYDYLGNPKQWFKHSSIDARVGYDLSWSKVSRLTGVTDLDTKEKYEYTYNHRGIRTGKKVGNTVYRYYLDGTSIVAETRTTGGKTDVLKYYYGATGLVGFNYNGADYYYKKNMRGDIVRIYDATGEPCGQYRYDAWGKCTVEWDPNGIAEINPFRYRSYYLDNETGLCYLNSRYYDAHIGRFLTPDSLDYLDPETINGLNLYAYCGNNPVNYYDPSGHVVISLIVALMIAGGVIGAIVGGLIAGMTSYDNGDRGWSLFGHIMLGGLFGGAVGVAAGFVMGVLGPAIGGMGAMVLGDTMAMSGAFAAAGVAVEVLTVAAAGALVAAGAGALGNVRFSKNANRNQPKDTRSNYTQNKEFDMICDEYGLNINQRERLHRKISKKGLKKTDIIRKIKELFPHIFE